MSWGTILNSNNTGVGFSNIICSYPHFFNVDTDQCDTASFAYNKNDKGGPFLTKDIRGKINDLIEQMNNAIRSAIAATNNPNIQFVE